MSPGTLLDTERGGIVRMTGCIPVSGKDTRSKDILFDRTTGKIIDGQDTFYGSRVTADEVIDLGGRILCPGFIDVQFNGAFNFDFSEPSRGPEAYVRQLRDLNANIVKTGVTSYLPTVTSQRREVYHQTLPFLGPSGLQRDPSEGAESLGAHCEGPFISPCKNGIHNLDVLLSALEGYPDLEDCYGSSNLQSTKGRPPQVKMITAAPEVGSILKAIPEIADRGIVVAVGHSEATYDEAAAALEAGSTMVTHLFNQMTPLHHRTPGIFGLLGRTSQEYRPYFGIIADGIHLHPSVVKLAYTSHPDGLILVTDAMSLLGMDDGTYDWTNGDRIIKKGSKLILEGTDRIAGGTATLLDCVNNFLDWSGVDVADAIRTVTETPAKMLGMEKIKGVLNPGADADFVVLDYIQKANGKLALMIHQVWKFGELVYQHDRSTGDVRPL